MARRNVSADVMGNADADEDDGESRFAGPSQPRVLRDVAGDAVVRHAAGGEQRQLLPAHQAVHQVDGGDAGFDEVPRQLARGGIDRDAVDAQALARGDRGPPSTGSPTPLNTRPSRPGPTAKCSGSARKRMRTSRKPRPMVNSSTSITMAS